MITLILLTLLIDIEEPGCTKDTDCKGDRICDADARCVDPIVPTLNTVMPSDMPLPVRSSHRYHAPLPRYTTVHNYVAPGVACILFGTVGISIGTGVLVNYKRKLTAAGEALVPTAEDQPAPLAATGEFGKLAAKGPSIHAGTGVAIAAGVALVVTGIVLVSVTEKVRVAYDPSLGLGFRF